MAEVNGIKRVLFVDDLPGNRTMYISFFQDWQDGYEITAVDGLGAKGLLIGGEQFDLIVSEIVLEVLERDDVMPFYRKYAPNTPVILVTSTNFLLVRAIGATEAKGIQAQAEGYLFKEFSWLELKEAMEKALTVQLA